MDTGNKVFFPYQPVIAAGLGISTVDLAKLVSWRNLTALVAPFTGVTADRHGYRPVIATCLSLSGIGFLTIFFSQGTAGFLIGIMLAALGGAAAGPNIHAYLSHRLPWEQRSRGLGMVEYAWGLASIVGVSLSGFLIDFTSWRMPFLIIGCAAFGFALMFMRFPPAGRAQKASAEDQEPWWAIFQGLFDLGANWRSAWATLLGDTFTRFAGFLLFINFGTWLSDQFDLGASGLATAVFWLGFSDIVGSVSVSLLGDRVGKRRSVIGGPICGAICFALLPFWTGGLVFVIVGIFLARAFFEFSIVSYLVLASEQTPEHRGKMLALRSAFSLISTFVSTRLGPQLYEAFGVPGFAWPAAISIGLSALVAIFLIRE